MTQTSDPRIAKAAAAQANRATRRGRSGLARPLHTEGVVRVCLLAMLGSGCFPPSLSRDTTDAALNSPPSIISVRADGVELPEWSDVIFEVGAGTLDLVVYDTDLGDILEPKVFVNYSHEPGEQTPPRSTCSPAAGGTVERTSTCPVGLCQNADIGQTQTMQIVVFDHPVIEGQSPLYMAMGPVGLQTTRTYFLKCQAGL
jgi:hypothetical protein